MGSLFEALIGKQKRGLESSPIFPLHVQGTFGLTQTHTSLSDILSPKIPESWCHDIQSQWCVKTITCYSIATDFFFFNSYCSPGMGNHVIWEGLKQRDNKVMAIKNDHQIANVPRSFVWGHSKMLKSVWGMRRKTCFLMSLLKIIHQLRCWWANIRGSQFIGSRFCVMESVAETNFSAHTL